MFKYLILVALFLSGCSQTTVHLYTKYLSIEQVEEINQTLTNKNFVVVTNEYNFPETVSNSTLIYSPIIQDRKAVDNLIQLLQGLK